MQISHIFSELGTGLKRNVSMTVSLVVTTFVSLTLVGFGLLVNSQANQTEEYFGDRLTVQVILCSNASTTGTCLDGAANENQRTDIEAALDENPEVKSFDFQTSREAYDKAKELYTQNPSGERAFEFTTPDRFPASYFVVLNDPKQFTGVEGSTVSVADTVEAFSKIADGEYDHVAEQAFFMCGGLDDVEKKWAEIQKQTGEAR